VRRALALALGALALFAARPGAAAGPPDEPGPFEQVRPGGAIAFPADEGAHPAFRTEWWYVTGWLEDASGAPLGFQVTFFRNRPGLAEDNPSAFAARELLIAHAALSDPALGHARHAERIAREGFGLAQAALGRTAVSIRDWRLEATGDALEAHVAGEDFALELTLARSAPPMPNGQQGYSQKGPAATSASWYYSLPQLAVSGSVREAHGAARPVTGRAWLDHEWSSAYLDQDSVGWDWVGLNLADGGALMAFRIRDRDGRQRFAGGTRRAPDGRTHVLAPGEIAFTATGRWRSPRTGIDWPVVFTVQAGLERWQLTPLLKDQESDSRLTTGTVYWEGAVRAAEAGGARGRGYLELTGYGAPLRLH